MPHPSTTLSRRAALGALAAGAAGATLGTTPGSAQTDHVPAPRGMSPDQALDLLRQGNAAFVSQAPYQQPSFAAQRLEVAREQHPFVVLVGCSDSRVPPEILFGRGLGELFIVRVAGNTAESAEALGSIEYAVEHLGVPLVVVLGHERCGAVSAAVSVVTDNTHFSGSIGEMIEPIIPAVLEARGLPGDLLDNAVRTNVQRVVAGIKETSPLLASAAEEGRIRVVGARYDLEDGRVEFFDA